MMVSFASVDSVADLRILYGFVLSQDPRKEQVQHVLDIIDSQPGCFDLRSVQVDKLRKTFAKFSLDVLLC